jgi:hypothetical protein
LPALTDVFLHDFKDEVSAQTFEIFGDASTVVQESDGSRVSLSGSRGVSLLRTEFRLMGDFDIEVVFRDLTITPVRNQTSGIALVLNFDAAAGDNCGLYRRYQGANNVGPNNQHRLLFAYKQADPDGKLVYSGTGIAQESTSGRIRLARRGDKVYGLYAEEDSPHYRVITSRSVDPAEAQAYDVRLLLQAPGASRSEVVWQKLTVHAEEILHGLPEVQQAEPVTLQLPD